MKKIFSRPRALLMLLIASALSGGCARCTVEATVPPERYVSAVADLEHGEKVTHLLSTRIESWKLFGFIPVVTGNINRPNSGTYKLFRDYADAKYAERVLQTWGREGLRGDRVAVMNGKDVFIGWWSLWIVCYKVTTMDAEVLKY